MNQPITSRASNLMGPEPSAIKNALLPMSDLDRIEAFDELAIEYFGMMKRAVEKAEARRGS